MFLSQISIYSLVVVDVFSFSADISLTHFFNTFYTLHFLSSRYQKLDAKKNWDDMARRVVDVSTVEDFWQVELGLSTFQHDWSHCRSTITWNLLAT